ncbi:DUF6049 family protein [Microbacterium oleivorans]|uniref:Pyruvate/2-oxoglutarate dehydrogenase complex, dihydrolipoamide acyltransferase (E2) component n=1 Tax=Microbacterium oleivorans TaxID=273677 RepID=A0A031FSA7_9MICO|nr:DUF6049 family protein [Microbacterium oleivorans]EZP27699.1 Pyruvate/2-oxoglutarate dehydrogenase complex, dihydrolipoamide acyltransferase (E2) component [Microbacterium oleivorans]
MDRTGIDLFMTFISPVPGRRPPRRSRWLCAATAASAVLALASPVPAAFAAVDDPADGEAATAVLAPANDGVLSASAPLTLTLSADNPTATALAAGEATFEFGTRALTTRGSLDSWLDSGAAAVPFDAVGESDVPEVAGQQSASVSVSVAPDDAALEDLEPGIYPVRVAYTTGDETLRARTVVVVPRTGEPTQRVGVIVPITAGPQTTGALGADVLRELTADGGALREQLDAVSGTDAILAVDPAIAASIRALGKSAPADAVAWLDELMSLPNERFALQYGDADLAAQVGAGAASPGRMTSFSAYLDAANFEVTTDAAGATPAPSPTPGQVALPSLDALFDVGADRDAVYWPATGTAGAETATALSAVTGTQDTPVTLLPSSLARSDAAAHATAGDADLLVYNEDLSGLLAQASTTGDATERASALAEYTARATLIDPAGPLLVTVDRANGRSEAELRDAIRGATALPGWTTTGLDGLLAADPASVRPVSVTPDADRVAVIKEFRAAQPGLSRIAGVLDDPSQLASSERATELQLLGNGWLGDPDGWDAAVQTQRERIATWTDGVALVPGGPITLAGTSAPLVFTVRNDLPWPARVDLLAAPNDARLVIESTTEVEIGAQQTSRVAIPVSALVGSGESSVDLKLRTPAGVEIGPTETINVSVRAEWEAVSIIILSVLVSVLLVFGVVRTVRRRRRMPVDA